MRKSTVCLKQSEGKDQHHVMPCAQSNSHTTPPCTHLNMHTVERKENREEARKEKEGRKETEGKGPGIWEDKQICDNSNENTCMLVCV